MVLKFDPHLLDPCSIVADDCKLISISMVEKTNCDTASCALRKNSAKNKFHKISGPNNVNLLNNINIDSMLEQMGEKFPEFFPYNFNMRNYHEYSFGESGTVAKPDTLATISIEDLHKENYRRCGCVINTDVYQNSGEHWMALFADWRTEDATVEFFNSSGNRPQKEFNDWIVRAMRSLQKLGYSPKKVIASKFEHQKSMTECGVYSLYYIWSRLNEVPYKTFQNNTITDEKMFEFRTMIFDDPKFITAHLNYIFGDSQFLQMLDKKLHDGSDASNRVLQYMKDKKVKFCNRPLRYLIMVLLRGVPEFDTYTKFNYEIYKKLVDVKFE